MRGRGVRIEQLEPASGTSGDFEIQQITDFTGDTFFVRPPATTEQHVVYRADSPGGPIYPNLFLHDLSTGHTRQITDFSGTYSLGDPAISDGKVAYMASPSGLTPVNVFVYDVASQRTTQITDFGPVVNQLNPTTPGISGDLVAYHADYPHGGPLYPNLSVYNLTTGQTTQITDFSGTYTLSDPTVCDGQVAYMADPPGSTRLNVYVYDVATGATTAVTNNTTLFTVQQTTTPSISGGTVAFRFENPPPTGKADIFVATRDIVPPSADVEDVAPDPRTTSVAEIIIAFDEPVTGFAVDDLTLTRDGSSNLLTASQTLTTSDQQTWTLANLAPITGLPGNYQLTLTASGSGIVDQSGNPLAADAVDSWATVEPLRVVNITLNDGQAQRSNVASMTIQLNQAANLQELIDSGAILDAVQLHGLTNQPGPVGLATSRFSWAAATTTLSIDLTSDGFGGSERTILPDDDYELRIVVSYVLHSVVPGATLEDNDGQNDGIYRFAFHRLAGDFDGDRNVGQGDYGFWFDGSVRFGATVGENGYDHAYDFDDDGRISSRDYYYWLLGMFGNNL